MKQRKVLCSIFICFPEIKLMSMKNCNYLCVVSDMSETFVNDFKNVLVLCFVLLFIFFAQ